MSASPHRRDALRNADYLRGVAEQAFSRAAGAPLIGGNQVELLIDGRANYDAWLAAIASAKTSILFENYIFRSDDIGRIFLDALIERARAGVRVHLLRDWLGCLGQSSASFWQPLIDAGGEVREFRPFRFASPLSAINRDHRKSLVVDANVGFISGICVSDLWLGDAKREIAPWRDTGVSIRGPAVGALIHAFEDNWSHIGTGLSAETLSLADNIAIAGDADLRVVATRPNDVGLYRLDQLVAVLAQRSLWISDAYFVGTAAYVQALSAAARDGIDVRLLVPGSSDIPAVGSMSRAGYRPLLEAGVRVFEWNGSMMHAKTAVADSRWARVGSTNLNIASWIGNCEIDVAIENADFAQQMERQYERDLDNATEIVLAGKQRVQRRTTKVGRKKIAQGGKGSSGRVAASAVRMANNFGAAFTRRRELGRTETKVLLMASLLLAALAVVSWLWPRVLAWPLAVLSGWFSITMALRWWRTRSAAKPPPTNR